MLKVVYNDIKSKALRGGFLLLTPFHEFTLNNPIKLECTNCGYKTLASYRSVVSGDFSKRCPSCLSRPMRSTFEDFIYHLLRERKENVICNYRMRLPNKKYFLDLDLYLPDRNIAIECNGLAFHNENYVYKDYHKFKTEECLKQGIKLFHLWDAMSDFQIETYIDIFLGNSKPPFFGADEPFGKIHRISRDISPIDMWAPHNYQFLYVTTPECYYWISPECKDRSSLGILSEKTKVLPGKTFSNNDMTNKGLYRFYTSGTLVYRRV